MAVVLGLNAGHPDSSAVLVVDGTIKGACAEERLGKRIKHSNEFPLNATRAVLDAGGLDFEDIDAIAIASDPRKNIRAKIQFGFKNPKNLVGSALASFRNAALRSNSSVTDILTEEFSAPEVKRFRGKVLKVEHHLSHIASAYYTSGFEGAVTGLSYDGSGDFVSLMLSRCESGRIEVLDRVHLPHSLGIFYTALCQFIGFHEFGEEYKVMGLAPYGKDLYGDELSQLIGIDKSPNGWFWLNQQYFNMHSGKGADHLSNPQIEMGQLYSPALEKLLGAPRIDRSSPIEQRHMDIARSTQAKFEEIAIAMVEKACKRVSSSKIVLSGGCALNGVCNARILRDTDVDELYVHPASSDDGTAAGAALYVAANFFDDISNTRLKSPFFGPIRRKLFDVSMSKLASIYSHKNYETFEETAEIAASFIADGMVVGWYQGRSEWGPRALGNRSILGNPLDPTMKEKINKKIKKREGFRPFAPSVLEEDADIYFSQSVNSPYMTFVVPVREEWRKKLPAITHVDGTARIQTVSKENNDKYYYLLNKVKARTGIGMVLNTSFNENEPVVETPEQAYACFERTDMDVLVIDNTIFTKNT